MADWVKPGKGPITGSLRLPAAPSPFFAKRSGTEKQPSPRHLSDGDRLIRSSRGYNGEICFQRTIVLCVALARMLSFLTKITLPTWLVFTVSLAAIFES